MCTRETDMRDPKPSVSVMALRRSVACDRRERGKGSGAGEVGPDVGWAGERWGIEKKGHVEAVAMSLMLLVSSCLSLVE